MSQKFTLEFPENQAGEQEGLHDAGIETFRDAPYASCAREIGQNSRDAAKDFPVRIRFDLFKIYRTELPSTDILEQTIQACLREPANQKDPKAISFLKHALNIVQTSDIPVLSIQDFNTTGLKGPPDDAGSQFHALVKGSGITIKDQADSGGSFGIGKNAVFAVSDLHTVFYSTIWADSEKQAFAAQGKTRLTSHQIDEKKFRATGWWGNDGFKAVTDRTIVPPWMHRDEPGTSIFSIGFRKTDDWKEQMAAAIIVNFFAAIHKKEMVFELDDDYLKIDHDTIKSLFKKSDIKQAAIEESAFDFSCNLYDCLISRKSKRIFITPDEKNSKQILFRMHILIQDDLPKKIGFIRNGMLITDNLKHFGHPLQRFDGMKGFIAIIEPGNEETSNLLKEMENPSHSDFSHERINDEKKRKKSRSIMRKLGKKIREIIKEQAGFKPKSSTIIDELKVFFPPEGADISSAEKPGNGGVTVTPVSEPDDPTGTSRPGGSGAPGSTRTKTPGGNTGTEDGTGKGSTPNPGKRVPLSKVKNIIRSSKVRTLFLAGNDKKKRVFQIFSPGISGSEELGIRRVEAARSSTARIRDPEKGIIEVESEENQSQIRLEIELAIPYEGPLEIEEEINETEETFLEIDKSGENNGKS